jgi:hypothetical protein
MNWEELDMAARQTLKPMVMENAKRRSPLMEGQEGLHGFMPDDSCDPEGRWGGLSREGCTESQRRLAIVEWIKTLEDTEFMWPRPSDP